MTLDPKSPVQRYFAGLAENTFHSQLGVVDPPLIDYLSDLLIRFIRCDRAHRGNLGEGCCHSFRTRSRERQLRGRFRV